MLLAVDIGNANIKFGIFDGDDLISRFSLPTDATPAALTAGLRANIASPIRDSIICSVVPEMNEALVGTLRQLTDAEPLLVRNDLDLGLSVDYDPLDSLGTDRLVNAFAASAKYSTPCIVCSFGTATTIDVVSEARFRGGLIAPGLNVLSRALHLSTSRLPDITLQQPATPIQNSTTGAINAGVTYGYVAMVEGLISRMRAASGDDAAVIGTGGSLPLVARFVDHADENLLLNGLRLLHRRLYPE